MKSLGMSNPFKVKTLFSEMKRKNKIHLSSGVTGW